MHLGRSWNKLELQQVWCHSTAPKSGIHYLILWLSTAGNTEPWLCNSECFWGVWWTLFPKTFSLLLLNLLLMNAAEKIRIWRKGVDSDSFHPRFKSAEMRNKLTWVYFPYLQVSSTNILLRLLAYWLWCLVQSNRKLSTDVAMLKFSDIVLTLIVCCSDGKPETPTIIHVGRLGVEKSLDFLVKWVPASVNFYQISSPHCVLAWTLNILILDRKTCRQ